MKFKLKNPNKSEFERLVRSVMFENGITLRQLSETADIKGDGSGRCAISYVHKILTSPDGKYTDRKKRIAKQLGIKWNGEQVK